MLFKTRIPRIRLSASSSGFYFLNINHDSGEESAYKWKAKNGFIDPCSQEYDKNLQRDDKGQIQPITERGEYIIQNLQLHLKRHEVIWTLSRLEKKKQQLKTLSTNGVNKLEVLKNELIEIQEKIDAYMGWICPLSSLCKFLSYS
jgi:hypothetical protein